MFTIFKEIGFIGSISALMGTAPLILAAFFGSMQNCFARASKFTFFDVTKEMAFIPLSKECKLKGKAAIDGVGSRLGKSGGSLVYQCLLIFFGTISLSAPYVAGIFLFVIVAWLLAVKSLGKQFNELSASKEKLTIPDEVENPPLKESPALNPS